MERSIVRRGDRVGNDMSNVEGPPNSCPEMSPLARPGALVGGRYELDSIIDYGGMGVIWRAKHSALGQVVAIKLISSRYASSRAARSRFAKEARVAAALRSRYAVQVTDYGELDDGTPYIVMELLHGEALDRRIHRTGPLCIEDTARVLAHVGRALSAAHAAGIVHRDIKPDNIFLATSDEEDGFIAKVLDFGVAKMSLDQLATNTTRTGALLGTPRYMSPEQARGSKAVDFKTDLYSLGAVAYTMLTGNLVFDADTLGEMVLLTCGGSLPSIADSAPWVPPEVDAWFHRACARAPEDRFESAQQMVDAFCAAAATPAPPRNSVPDRISGFGAEGSDAAITILQSRASVVPHAGLAFSRCCAVTVQDRGQPQAERQSLAPPRGTWHKWALWALICATAALSPLAVCSVISRGDAQPRAYGHAYTAAFAVVGMSQSSPEEPAQPACGPETPVAAGSHQGSGARAPSVRFVAQTYSPLPKPPPVRAEPRKDNPIPQEPAPSATVARSFPGPLEDRQ